jgi:hypothetical protein
VDLLIESLPIYFFYNLSYLKMIVSLLKLKKAAFVPPFLVVTYLLYRLSSD